MSVRAERAPGAGLLHPLSALCWLLLVVNDHVLKRACPGFVTGKLSDFAGVLLLPLFFQACFELAHARLGRAASARASNIALGVGALFTVLGFGGAELSGLGDAAFRHGLGLLQWPYYAVGALLRGEVLPRVRAVRATADVTDLVALPMVAVACVIGRRRLGLERARRVARAPLACALGVVAFAFAAPAKAEPSKKFEHDGFFMSFELGVGAGLLNSTASISNGFQQSIASSARGVAFPTGALELGGTLRGTGIVLGGRLGLSELQNPVVHTLGESLQIPDSKLTILLIQGVARWYPDPQRGEHVGVGVGGMSVAMESDFNGELQRGFSISLEAGKGFWIAPQWSLAVGARLTGGRVFGDDFGRTTVFLPAISAAIVLH